MLLKMLRHVRPANVSGYLPELLGLRTKLTRRQRHPFVNHAGLMHDPDQSRPPQTYVRIYGRSRLRDETLTRKARIASITLTAGMGRKLPLAPNAEPKQFPELA